MKWTKLRPRSWHLPYRLTLTHFRMVTATAIECNRLSEAGVCPISTKQSFKRKPTGRQFHFCNTRRNYPTVKKKEERNRNTTVKCSLFVYGSSKTLLFCICPFTLHFLYTPVSICLLARLQKDIDHLFFSVHCNDMIRNNFGEFGFVHVIIHEICIRVIETSLGIGCTVPYSFLLLCCLLRFVFFLQCLNLLKAFF